MMITEARGEVEKHYIHKPKSFSKHRGYQQKDSRCCFNELIASNVVSEVSIKFIVLTCVINENYLVRWF